MYGPIHQTLTDILLDDIAELETLTNQSAIERKQLEIAELRDELRKIRKVFIPDHIKAILDDKDGKVLIFFSGGKDSVAMSTYLHFTLGIPWDRMELWHHEIDGAGEAIFDWPCTPSYCQSFADAFNAPLLFSYREGGIAREIDRKNEGLQDVLFQEVPGGPFIRLKSKDGNSTRGKFPAVTADLRTRWCSPVVKIDVGGRAITNSTRFKRGNFLVCSGERREESKNRSTYDLTEPYRAMTKERNIHQWRPVIEWTEEEVWNEYAKHLIQPHPCYELGYSRCSCFTCIFLGANGWASTADLSPERVDWFDKKEQTTGFTLYHKMTIREKVTKGKSFVPPAMRERWGAEALGKFTSPIILDTFTLPAGAFGTDSAGSV